MTKAASPWALPATVQGKAASVCIADRALEVVVDKSTWLHIPIELVLDVTWTSPTLSIAVVAPRRHLCHAPRVLSRAQWTERHKNAAELEPFTFEAQHVDGEGAEWAAHVMQLAYHRTRPQRRVLIICNPFGGKGHAKKMLDDVVKPTFNAARCTIHVVETKKRGDAYRSCESLDVSQYDALACVGGDGTLHESLNGLACRTDAAHALTLPVVPVPAGSGNGLFVSLHGTAVGFSAVHACLSAIKGVPYTHELVTVTQPQDAFTSAYSCPYTLHGVGPDGRSYVQYYSFMSQAIGIIADIDIGTESWRFMGDARFELGYVLSVLRNRPCPITVEVCFGPSGTASRADMYHAAKKTPERIQESPLPVEDAHQLLRGSVLDPLPTADVPLRLSESARPPTDDTWTRLDVSVSSVYAGKVPFVSRGLMAFPYTCPSDGLMDVLIQDQRTSALQKISATLHGESGDHIFDRGMHYIKVHALRITPHPNTPRRFLSVDGEMVPYAPIQVEVSPLRITLLTLSDDEWSAPSIRAHTIQAHASRYP